MNSPQVFISYSHKDEVWKDRVVTQLGVLVQEAKLELWDDRRIAAGDDWLPKIEHAIQTCDVALFLISADFLTSQFILSKEVHTLLQRRANEGICLIPVILRPCAWTLVSWLGRIQARPKDGKALTSLTENGSEEALAALAEEVLGLTASLREFPTHPPGKQPVVPPSSKAFATTRLPDTSQLSFVGRDAELALIDTAWTSNGPQKSNIICFVGQGGEGKTALMVRWLTKNHYGQHVGALRYFDWSFYSQGTTDQLMASADAFFDAALRWFGEAAPERLVGWVKGERLAELVRDARTLLVLDGLEPLQYPPGPLAGQLKDIAIKALLLGLAQSNPGLCLLTTRAAIADIEHFQRTTVINRDLLQLRPEDGVTLLRNLNVRGPDEELRNAVAAFEGHALALNLLGNYLRSETEDHDIGRWREVPLLEEDEEEGGHARRVLRAYEKWLGPSSHTVALLRLLGLFGRPAESKCLDVLRQKPGIPGLTDAIVGLPKAKWIRAVHHLEGLRLVGRRGDALDAHALIREYFASEIKSKFPDAWREAQSRLYEFLRDEVPQYPATLEEMRPLYHAVAHGCAATRYVECLDVFYERICRTGEDFAARKLGAYSADLGAISGFFDRLWTDPVESLPDVARAYLLNTASRRIPALGRLRDACEPAVAAMELDIRSGSPSEAARTASALCGYHALFGELDTAVRYGRQGVELADQSKTLGQRIRRRASLADALHQSGAFDEAAKLFNDAEQILCEAKRRTLLLKSFAGHQYCDLLISLNQFDEAERRARAIVRMARRDGAPFETCVGLLDQCRIMLARAESDAPRENPAISALLEEAEKYLNLASREDYLPRYLFVRACFSASAGNAFRALADIAKAEAIAKRSDMQLYIADATLLRARIAKDRLALAEARKIVERCKYWRRKQELEDTEQAAMNWPTGIPNA